MLLIQGLDIITTGRECESLWPQENCFCFYLIWGGGVRTIQDWIEQNSQKRPVSCGHGEVVLCAGAFLRPMGRS